MMLFFLISRTDWEKEENQKQPLWYLTKYFLSVSSFPTKREGCLYPGYDRFQKQIVRGHNLQWKESAISHAVRVTPVFLPGPSSTNDDLPVATPHSRSSWNCNIWYVKPIPSSPMRFLQGTLTSSKKIWAVSDDLMPSLSIFLAMWIPEEKHINLEFNNKVGTSHF